MNKKDFERRKYKRGAHLQDPIGYFPVRKDTDDGLRTERNPNNVLTSIQELGENVDRPFSLFVPLTFCVDLFYVDLCFVLSFVLCWLLFCVIFFVLTFVFVNFFRVGFCFVSFFSHGPLFCVNFCFVLTFVDL